MRSKLKFSQLVLLAVSCTFFHPTLAQTDASLVAKVRKAGEIKGALASAPPYLVISPDGKATGYTIDLANLVVKGMGLPEITPVQLGWSAQIPAMLAGQVDFVSVGYAYLPASCENVVYSGPIFAQHYAFYVPSGNPARITGSQQIGQNPNIKIAVVSMGPDTPQSRYMLEQGIKREQYINVPDFNAGVAAVLTGRANALLLGQFIISRPEQKGLEVIVDKGGPVSGSGYVFRKEDVAFRDAFNKQLNELRSNGTMKEMLIKALEKNGVSEKDAIANWDVLSKLTKASDLVPSCE
ncbi:transporter substrate-binding domain-containing protein [Bradyrhizobium sp. BWA-3-5]|uniref:transporter substrate-binding domain-containing protein n=1 Tax=Bradyrhizobium sp. BWA-3-5 TaxID=3080013 RepID=UPI00293E4902|nr:transporter substrate-binding domain-containing protein [Bradyrhizobium sp. BWA-3-5]WOH63922.1 transporter substrate-binding domain-containing protein [Bradyrhizobium sp. BWA-3-5]